jgi:hypothetical protein
MNALYLLPELLNYMCFADIHLDTWVCTLTLQYHSFYEELECICDQFPKYHMKIL